MVYIYKITTLINNKIYIGLTTRTVEMRWKEHVRGTQYIDNAIKEFGKENFIIETIEECEDDVADDREIYWIQYYDSYHNGYNYTLGGRDNKLIMTDKVQEVLDLWNQGLTVNRIIEKTKLNVETVRGYLNKNGIDHAQIKARANIFIGKAKAKAVGQFDLEGNLIKTWESQAQIIRETGISKSTIQRAIQNKDKVVNNSYWRLI